MFALNFKLPLILWYCTRMVLCNYNLHLLHVNDIHARFEQTNKYSGRCKTEDAGRVLLIFKISLFTSKFISNSSDSFTNSLTMNTLIFQNNEYCYLHEQYTYKKNEKLLEKQVAYYSLYLLYPLTYVNIVVRFVL